MSDIDDLRARLADAPQDAGAWSVRVSTLRELLRELDEARAREDSCLAALLKIRVEMGLHRDSGDDLAVHAGQLLAERNVARADLARVTAERDEWRGVAGSLQGTVNRLFRELADRDALAAKLERAKGLLRETDAALTDMVNEYAASANTYLDISGRNADYFAASEQEPRT